MEKYESCIGERYGNLVISEKTDRPDDLKYGGNYWVKCNCDCGSISIIPYRALLYKNTKSCGCLHKRNGKHSPFFKGCGELPLNVYTKIKGCSKGGTKANRKPKEFDVSIEYLWDLFLKQDRKCAITGIVLSFEGTAQENKRRATCKLTASLDRIDSSKGYIEGNVQWLHKDINMMKNAHVQKYFIELCKLVAKNN